MPDSQLNQLRINSMEEPPTVPEPQPEVARPPSTSLAARLLNIFAVPGEVFDEVKAAPTSALNWLVPVLCLAVVGVLSAVIIFSQPAIQQQIREQQAKKMDQVVKSGKMTQADADKALAMMDKFTGPTMMKIFGAVGGVVGSFVHVFWWAFILWLLGRWLLKAPLEFPKTLEVAGLASMIAILGGLVSLLLTVSLTRIGATPSLALVVKDFDLTRKSHLFLGAANLFSFWLVALMALGLAKLAGVPWLKAAFPVFTYWLAKECLLIGIGMGQMAL
jgi:hypothetical protein